MSGSFIAVLSIVLTTGACGNDNTGTKNNALPPDSAVQTKNMGNTLFSCKVNEQLVINTEDPGIYNPMVHKITVVAESDKYVVGVVIPMNVQAGQVCNSCTGYVQQKIMHEEGLQERKLFELLQNISVHITARRGNHFEGTFSFTVKLKMESDQQMTVTDGTFITDIE